MTIRILIAEDEAVSLKLLTSFLVKEGFEVRGAGDGAEALHLLDREPFDLLLADIKMPGLDGLSLLSAVRERHPGTAVFIVTGFGSIDTAIDAMKRGALDYLTKPINLDELLHKVRRVAEKKSLEIDNAALRLTIAGEREQALIGRSAAFRRITETIENIRDSDCTVLLTGESGVGKGLVARLIHETSRRREKPFLSLNCALFTEDLLASELFGHEKGSFTGAVAAKRGLVEVADGGTLFLDEVAEMTPSLQAKLLKLIEDREFHRVGGTRALHADIRFVAATNRNLTDMLASGRFREDLYYRLNVMGFRIPPLRERREDIAPLARHFLERLSRRAGKRIAGFSEDALRRLREYGFPGNVRELENIVERAVILEKSDRVRPESLPQSLGLFQVETIAPDRIRTLEELERDYAAQVLEYADHNKSRAAGLLGISRTSLWRLLKREDAGETREEP